MRFEWDENKNRLNQTKHSVSFEEAKEVFNDPLHLSKLDHRFSSVGCISDSVMHRFSKPR
jgi:hypothetical protein